MRGLAVPAASVLLCISAGCGLILDLDPGDWPADAGRLDATTADGGPPRDAAPGDAGARLDGAADAGPACREVEVRLTETATDEGEVTITPAPGGFAVAWESGADGTATVARWIRIDGTMGAVEWTIAATARTPSLAAGTGAIALAVGGPLAQLVLYDPSGVGFSTGSFTGAGGVPAYTHVTPDGDGWAIAWRETLGDGASRVVFQRFDAVGALRAPADFITDGAFEPDEPSVAQIGGRYVVVWDENDRASVGEPNGRWASFRDGDVPTYGVFGVESDDAFVTAAAADFAAVWVEKAGDSPVMLQLLGSIEGLPRGTPLPLTSGGAHRDEPAVAWNGTEWGVVFEEGSASTTDGVIRLVSISADGGSVLAERQVSHGTAYAEAPQVAWSGAGWGVVWEDRRDGNSEVYYAHVCP